MNSKIFSALLTIFILQSCGTNRETISQSKTIWISGYKAICQVPEHKMACLQFSDDNNLRKDKWETFHGTIQGFNFQNGYLQKIIIIAEKKPTSESDSDQIALKYKLKKVLKKKKDKRVRMQDYWTLDKIKHGKLEKTTELSYLFFDLNKKTFSGSNGCNNFFGNIKNIGLNAIELERIFTTVRGCDDNVNQFNSVFNSITAYEIKNHHLNFLDASKNKVISFTNKAISTANFRIHDIFVAKKFNGIEISSREDMPTLEINLNTMKIYGTNGCNSYTGNIDFVTENLIFFRGLSYTKKTCSDMDFSKMFDQALAQASSYKFENLHLTLFDKHGKELITFLKVD